MELFQLIVSVTGVIFGFLIGFFAEPVKNHFSTIRDIKLLREGMYKEMAFFYERMVSISFNSNQVNSDWDTYKKSLRTFARFECYEYAKSNPMLFYQIEESHVINQIYANYTTYIEGFLFDNVESHVGNANGVVEIVRKLVVNKKLNKALFLKSLSEKTLLDI